MGGDRGVRQLLFLQTARTVARRADVRRMPVDPLRGHHRRDPRGRGQRPGVRGRGLDPAARPVRLLRRNPACLKPGHRWRPAALPPRIPGAFRGRLKIVAQEKSSTAYWLDLALKTGAPPLEGQKFKAGDVDLEFRPCPAAGAASVEAPRDTAPQ